MDAVLWQVRRTPLCAWVTVSNKSTADMHHAIGYEVRSLGQIEVWQPIGAINVSSSD